MSDSQSPALRNPVKQRLAAGDIALGMIVRMSRSGDIARIAKTSGHDFLFIDIQHAIFTLETIAHIAQTALGCGIAPLVRVRSVRDPDISVLLDGGVTGIVFPDVNTAEDARLGVSRCKYAPIGRRSVTSGYAIFDFRPMAGRDVMRILNENTLVVCMIESVEGLKNIDDIAAVDGVDGLLLGLTDLLADMGKPGALNDPAVLDAVDRLIAATRRHGKFAGCGGDNDLAHQAEYIRRGVRFISVQSDGAYLMAEASRVTGGIRAAAQKII